MSSETAHHVYKYFEPEDRFVRIRVARRPCVTPEGEGGLELDGATYRRLVVEECVQEELEDADFDALYRLVLDVNPELALEEVVLGTSVASPRRKGSSEDDGATFTRRLRRLARDPEGRLARRVLGQPRALASMASAVRRASLGWNARGPLAATLLVGPTGTGKTELAKALAAELGDEDLLIRIDCTEFAEGHEYAKLLGAPPGYVGHEEDGVLARALERHPRAVVLFDEVEKAHGRLHDLLLQVLDEGHATDAHGRKLDFTSCFVVLTSNAGTRELAESAESIGFGERLLAEAARDEIVRHALGERFRPEFLGRLDEVVLFDDLDEPSLARIAELHLTELATRVRHGGRRVKFKSSVARWLAREGAREGAGARGVLHLAKRAIEGPLAEACVGREKGWIEVSIRAGQPRVEPRRAP